jgi:hypothetical protein
MRNSLKSCSTPEQSTQTEIPKAIAALHSACFDNAPEPQQRTAAARVSRLLGIELPLRPFDLLMLSTVARARRIASRQAIAHCLAGGDLVDQFNALMIRG